MSSSETCNCTTEESSSLNKDSSTEVHVKKESARLKKKNEIEFLEIELTKDELNLIPSSSSSESQICDPANLDDDTCSKTETTTDSKDSLKTCTCSNEEICSLKTCTCSSCTSKESLKTCICSETCESREIEIVYDEAKSKIIECTLAIIKPDAMIYRTEIEREIITEGFKICQRRWLRLTPEQVSDFYRDNYKQRNFAHLVSYMSSEPILVFILSKCNAIQDWKLFMGPRKVRNAKIYAPDSIRSKYGRKGDDMKNVVHGSDNQKAAEREINFFFPDRTKEPVLSGEDAIQYLKKHVNELLTDGLIKCCQEKPEDPITWLGNWLLENNAKRPKYLYYLKLANYNLTPQNRILSILVQTSPELIERINDFLENGHPVRFKRR